MGSFVTSAFRCVSVRRGIVGITLVVALVVAPSPTAAQADSFSVYLQDGPCGELADLPEMTPVAVATPSNGSSTSPTATVLTSHLDASPADLLASPHSLVVDANRSDVAVTIACGDISGADDGNQVVVPVVSVEAGTLVGVGVLQPGEGSQHVVVEMYLVVSPDGEPIGATDSSSGADDGPAVVDDDDGSDTPDDEPEGGV